MKIKILFEARSRCDWLDDALADYEKRMEITWVPAKNGRQLIALAKKEKHLIGLDPSGTPMTSEEFSRFLHPRFTFVIGGPEGLPSQLKQIPLISLSPLTLTHQIARLVLVEQVYRATEIAKGSAYHK